MNITSIYEDHYRGETYRFGVAYLRVRSPRDERAPRHLTQYPLDTQRRIIASAAREQHTIIVGEYIEYGDWHHGLRPALNGLLTLAGETHLGTCFVVRESYLATRTADRTFWDTHFALCDIDLVAAIDRPRE